MQKLEAPRAVPLNDAPCIKARIDALADLRAGADKHDVASLPLVAVGASGVENPPPLPHPGTAPPPPVPLVQTRQPPPSTFSASAGRGLCAPSFKGSGKGRGKGGGGGRGGRCGPSAGSSSRPGGDFEQLQPNIAHTQNLASVQQPLMDPGVGDKVVVSTAAAGLPSITALYSVNVWEELQFLSHCVVAYVLSALANMPYGINPFPLRFATEVCGTVEGATHSLRLDALHPNRIQRGEIDTFVYQRSGAVSEEVRRLLGPPASLAKEVSKVQEACSASEDFMLMLNQLLDSPSGALEVLQAARALILAVVEQFEVSQRLYRVFMKNVSRRERWGYVCDPVNMLCWVVSTLDARMLPNACTFTLISWLVDPEISVKVRFVPREPLGNGAFGTALHAELFANDLRFARCVCKVQEARPLVVREMELLAAFAIDPHLPPTVLWSFGEALPKGWASGTSFSFMPLMGLSLNDYLRDPSALITQGSLWCMMADILAGVT